MIESNNLSDYRKELIEELENSFQRTAMDNFAVAYRGGRARAFADMDAQDAINQVAKAKDASIPRLMELYEQFKKNAEKAGVVVHLAKDAAQANEIIAGIAKENGCKAAMKSKSMTAEETHLNNKLEAEGLEVTESDLGEWIIQLRHEGPSHMVMPAIHLSRYQVADLFTDVTKKKQEVDIEKLVKVARRELRPKYAEADMGISGANVAIASTGTIATITNEGNARLVTTLPRVHVALIGLEKLCPSLNDALKILRVVPRNATGQAITSYVSWITGANECQTGPDGRKIMHIVFLDNGRLEMAKDPVFSEVLRCVRCGACANVCPVYRMVGGHKYGYVYIGAIGLILTYFFHGKDKARALVQNCINCEACKAVCAAGIDLPRIIKAVHARIQDEEGHPLPSTMLGMVLKNRMFFHGLLKAARFAQKPVTGGTPYLRHLPMMFMKDHAFKALPAIADRAFREEWPGLKPVVAQPKLKAALFSGCVQDFVYPEQMRAAVKVLAKLGADLEFPMGQSCCGLPVQMMGETKASRDVALQNVEAFSGVQADYIVTMCASCASHLKHNYPRILADVPDVKAKVRQFADKIIDFPSLVMKLGAKAEDFLPSGLALAYHAPCHLCRGMGVREAPRALMRLAGYDYRPNDEEEVCCGFGGTYSAKFPELSKELLAKKLTSLQSTGAATAVTDCPGCVMQIRGVSEKSGAGLAVRHLAEMLAEVLKD